MKFVVRFIFVGQDRIDFGASYMRVMRHEQLCFAASLHDNGCAI